MTLKERIKRLELNIEYNEFLGLPIPPHAQERLDKLKKELSDKVVTVGQKGQHEKL